MLRWRPILIPGNFSGIKNPSILLGELVCFVDVNWSWDDIGRSFHNLLRQLNGNNDTKMQTQRVPPWLKMQTWFHYNHHGRRTHAGVLEVGMWPFFCCFSHLIGPPAPSTLIFILPSNRKIFFPCHLLQNDYAGGKFSFVAHLQIFAFLATRRSWKLK